MYTKICINTLTAVKNFKAVLTTLQLSPDLYVKYAPFRNEDFKNIPLFEKSVIFNKFTIIGIISSAQ